MAFCGVLRLRDAGNVLTKTVKLYLYYWKNDERTKILEEGLAGTTETEYTYDNAGHLIGEENATIESWKPHFQECNGEWSNCNNVI